jgi:hypothetical protein
MRARARMHTHTHTEEICEQVQDISAHLTEGTITKQIACTLKQMNCTTQSTL